jgi:hypothetical protein
VTGDSFLLAATAWNKFMKVLNDASKGNCRNLVAWNGCNGSGGLSSS